MAPKSSTVTNTEPPAFFFKPVFESKGFDVMYYYDRCGHPYGTGFLLFKKIWWKEYYKVADVDLLGGNMTPNIQVYGRQFIAELLELTKEIKKKYKWNIKVHLTNEYPCREWVWRMT